MGQQIATYNNKVIELVPGYDLKDPSPNPGTITVTKDSVTHGTYASYSSGPTVQGMYIKDYSIGDGQGEYANNQLVAMKDLDYRYLVPNGIDSTSPTYEEKLSATGCVVSSNSSRTINKGDNYSTRLTPKQGYSKVPAGCIKVQTGVDAQTGEPIWERTLLTWSRTAEVQINLSAQDITGNLKIEFTESCVYLLTVLKKVGNTDLGLPIVREQTCEDRIDLNEFTGTETGLTYSNITDINGNEVIIEQEGNKFCGDTTLYINYVVNEYTITSNINNNCINLQLTSNGQPVTSNTIVHGSQLTIKLTPKQGKRNIGEGSITMEGYSPDFRWNNYKPNIEHSISSVTGNIVITANTCGLDDTYSVNVKWVNIDDEDNPLIISQHSYIVNISDSINAEYYRNDSDYAPDNTEYHYVGMTPPQGTIITESTEEIVYKYKHIYEVSFTTGPDSGITINKSTPVLVLHGETITVNNVYTVATGYETVTQTHTGSVEEIVLNDGDVELKNITSNVVVEISASQIPSYTVYFEFDNVNAGTIKINNDPVSAWEVRRDDHVGVVLCEFNEGYAFNGAEITQGVGKFNPNPPTNPFDVKDVHSDVYVIIHTTYTPPPVETYRITYELSGLGIQLKKDGAIVPSGTTDDVEAGSCSEIEYVLTDGYQFGGATSSVDSIEPTVDTTNKTVEVCPTSDVTITLTASQIQHTITYDIYVDGAKIDTLTQTVAEGETATLQYRKSNTEDYVNPPTVSSNDPNLTVNVAKSTGRGYTITGTPVTQDATISLYLVTKPTHTVTFKVYLDDDSEPMYTHNITCEEGDMFEDETYGYDTSLYELVEVTSEEIRVSYEDSDGIISMTSLDPITEDTTVEIYLSSIPQREVDSVTFKASQMDAMGGVAFQANVTYKDGGSETINNLNAFSVSYTGDDKVHSNEKPAVVEVYDYNFGTGTTVNYPKISGTDKVYQKCKLNLENTSTSSTSREVTVIWNGHSYTFTGRDAITQRGEQYGYYTDIDSGDTDLDAKLNNNSWKNNSLVDYGDSCNMYDAETKSLYSQGLDIYNKDITPYYITGTYVAENPLNHLDNNVKFYNNTLPVDYNKTNTAGYNDHYHITWIEQGPYDSTPTSNRVTTNMKGWVFKNDAYQLTSSICGGSAPECNCTVSSEGDSLSSISTLEAIDTELSGIERSISSSYDLSYVMPEHSYGRDSISYYHYKENSEYRTNINDETFKDSSDNVLNFSYPVHIKSDNTPKSIPMNRKNGPGGSNYATDSIRWEDETSHDSPSSYDRWNYTYYDYYNRIYPMFSETNSDLTGIHFEKYNQNYYNYDYDYDNVASIVNSRQLTDSESNDQGRIITLYSTFISMETMIRPVFNNGAKFATLDKKYNGLDNDNISPESREDFGVNNYVNLGRRTRYISKFFLGESGLAYNGSKDETLLTKQDDNDYGFDISSYPYAIESDPNIDYGRYYDNSSNEYTQATSYDLNLGYRNTHYNKIASISFSQYYNNPASNIQNYYAHNEDGAKYVICGDLFSSTGFYYLYDPLQSSDLRLSNWKNICAEGIKSITYNNSNGTYTIVTNNSTYTDYRRNTADYYARYYHKELLNLGTKLYTNANDITVEFDNYNCDDPKYGLGTIELTDVNDSSKKAVWKFGSLPEFIEDNLDELALNLKVSSDYQDGNINLTKTGGGTVKITCQWRNNQGDLIDTRIISGNIGGSCDRDNNPNESGSYLTWTDLNNIYSEETGGTITPFTNTGRELYIVNLDNKYYDLKNNEEIQ